DSVEVDREDNRRRGGAIAGGVEGLGGPGVGAVVGAGEGPGEGIGRGGDRALERGAVPELDAADADVVGGGGGCGYWVGRGVGGGLLPCAAVCRCDGVEVDREDDGRGGGAMAGGVVGLGGPGVGAVVGASEGPGEGIGRGGDRALERGA